MFSRKTYPKLAGLSLAFLVVRTTSADPVGYAEIREISSTRGPVICTHWHDWSQQTDKSRYQMISGDCDPFRADNNYAYVTCVDARSGGTLFREPSPALTTIWLSPDQRYLIGLSTLKAWNPYQFVVYRSDGKLVFKLHISANEACLTHDELSGLLAGLSREQAMRIAEHAVADEKRVFIDYTSPGLLHAIRGTAFGQLAEKRCPSHLSPNIRETTTNWVRWYNESYPGVAVEYNDVGDIEAVMLNDVSGQRITIPILLPAG